MKIIYHIVSSSWEILPWKMVKIENSVAILYIIILGLSHKFFWKFCFSIQDGTTCYRISLRLLCKIYIESYSTNSERWAISKTTIHTYKAESSEICKIHSRFPLTSVPLYHHVIVPYNEQLINTSSPTTMG